MMCERYSNLQTPEEIAALYGATDPLPRHMDSAPGYNIAPPQFRVIVRQAVWPDGMPRADRGRELVSARFGLANTWLKTTRRLTRTSINAACENLRSSPLYRGSFSQRRCIVPATSWYEWQKTGRRARQAWVVRPHKTSFGMAGIWSSLRLAGGERLESFAIVTVPAVEALQHIDARMPGVLLPSQFTPWLEGNLDVAEQQLKPFATDFEMWPVAYSVVSSRYNDQSLLAPLDPTATGQRR